MNTKLLAAVALALAVIAGIAFFLHRQPPAPRPVPGAPAMAVAPNAAVPPANCLLPGPPPVAPNGAVASDADMKLGHDVMQNFVLRLEAYQACRDAQADRAAPGVSQAQKDAWIAQGDDAVDEAHALADSFGVQLKIFKARSPGK